MTHRVRGTPVLLPTKHWIIRRLKLAASYVSTLKSMNMESCDGRSVVHIVDFLTLGESVETKKSKFGSMVHRSPYFTIVLVS